MTYTNFWEHLLVSSREQLEEHSRHLGIFGSTFGPGSTYQSVLGNNLNKIQDTWMKVLRAFLVPGTLVGKHCNRQ